MMKLLALIQLDLKYSCNVFTNGKDASAIFNRGPSGSRIKIPSNIKMLLVFTSFRRRSTNLLDYTHFFLLTVGTNLKNLFSFSRCNFMVVVLVISKLKSCLLFLENSIMHTIC